MDAAMERLLTMSLQGALLIAGLLLLMRIFRRRLPQWLPYAAWLLPALRLLIPFSMAPRPWSPTGLVQEAVREVAPPLSLMTVELPPAAESAFAPAEGHVPAVPAPTAAVSLLTLLFWVWVAGMAVTFLYALYVNIRFARNLGPRERIACSGCPLPVYRAEGVSSPCLYGLIRPRILLSAAALKDGEVAAMAIAHELAHYARRDHWTALLRGLCCIVHWFNPLVWFAAARARQDCELACDERAMKALDREGRERYGLALIELVAPGPRPLMAGGTAMSGNKGRLRERIAFIGRQPSVRRWAMVAALLIALPLCLLCCAEAPASLGIIGGADGPTAIFVTGDGEEPRREPYSPVSAPLEGEGWPSFASVMGEEIPYIALGTEIRLDGENLIVKDYLLSEDGRVRYQDGQGGPLGQEITLERDENGLFFLLPGNMATGLSSNSADYAPGAAIRGFLVTDGDGNSSGFVLRTDPSFLIEESDAASVGVIGGADGPTNIHITSRRDGEVLHEGDVIAITGGAGRSGIVLVAGEESKNMVSGTMIPENAQMAALPMVYLSSKADISAASAAAVAERLRADTGAERFDRLAAEGIQVGVYACVPYGAGELVLADFYWGGELAPDLFYLENNAVLARTYGADCWSVNYARIGADTIAFGRSFAWNGEAGQVGDIPTTRAEATFTEGAAECDMDTGAGFILIGRGDVRSVSLYDGNTLVADDSWHIDHDGPWAGTDAEILERLHFRSLYESAPGAIRDEAPWPTASFTPGGREYRLCRYAMNDGFTFPDLWRNNNWMHHSAEAVPGTPITVAFDAAPEFEAPTAEAAQTPVPQAAGSVDGYRAPVLRRREATRLLRAEAASTPAPRAAVWTAAWWVDPALDDGTAAGAERAVTAADAGNLRTPKKPGHHILVLDDGSGYLYTLPVWVQK